MSLLSVPGAKRCRDRAEFAEQITEYGRHWRVQARWCGGEAKDRRGIAVQKLNMDSGMFLPACSWRRLRRCRWGKDWYDSVNAVYRARRGKVFDLLDLLGCDFSKDQVGMFVWAAIPAAYKDGYALSDRVLYEAGVFITPGGIFGPAGEKYVRVSLCATEEKLRESIGRVRGAGIC